MTMTEVSLKILETDSTYRVNMEQWRSDKDLRKKCLAIISPVTPAKFCCCILIIFILVALYLVTLSALLAVRSRETDLLILYVSCPKGWIGFGSKCFYFSEDSKNWTFSQTSCTSVGAVLAQFETEEELNFLRRYKGIFDHWIGLSRESSHHAWKWTDNSKYNASFIITGDGERGYLNDLGVSSARSYTDRKWICSKQITSACP
ncbi:C-type lectin domain family 2 member D11-like isoform X1 [Bos indicus]|uniref:C-type lectin domain-containing protein n=2 Tax=Bos TaxID=9903 RepID=A0AAA9SP29_BOVIN|nr:C-type lectin domain family 2 member D11 isoform X1 [Bos taurus]